MYQEILEALALGIDVISLATMTLGALLAAVHVLRRPSSREAIEEARLMLGLRLLFALELMIVSDLIESAVSRELMDLAFLGGIVVIRTLIGYFLGRELDELKEG